MPFQVQQIWMSLIAFESMFSPEEVLDILEENGLKAELVDGTTDGILPWKTLKFQTMYAGEGIIVHCELFSADSPEVTSFLNKLADVIPADHQAHERLMRLIQHCKFIVQTTKYGTNFDVAAELEYGLQSCFSFAKEPNEGEGLWLLHSQKALAFASGEDVIMQMDPGRYDRCFGVA